ncbi:Vitamin B12 import ATP-binding protein BtuD [Castellaniella denitrificans]
MNLSFKQVEKHFRRLAGGRKLQRDIAPGELVALVGPSGCGKSTLLHMAAGLEKPCPARCWPTARPVRKPDPSRMLMFQENALYPWLTLAQNVAMALELQKVGRAEARRQALLWLDKVRLKDFEDYFPHQVSGGMRQRCALARAFITHPEVLLLDEPFGALDALTRMTLQDALRTLIRETRPTVLLVTHDVDEALFLADRILVFSARPSRVLKEFHPVGHRQDPRPVELRRHAPGNPGPAGHRRCHQTSHFHPRGTRSMKFLIPLLAALTLASQAQAAAAKPFKVGYIRVMDDAQAIAAYEGKFYEGPHHGSHRGPGGTDGAGRRALAGGGPGRPRGRSRRANWMPGWGCGPAKAPRRQRACAPRRWPGRPAPWRSCAPIPTSIVGPT